MNGHSRAFWQHNWRCHHDAASAWRWAAGRGLCPLFYDSFLHQASFGSGDWCYDWHRSVRLVIFSFGRLIRSHNPGWVPSKWSTIPRSYLVSKYEKLYRVISLISKNVSHAHFLFMVSIYRIYEYNKRLIQSFAKDITLYQIFSLSKTSVR